MIYSLSKNHTQPVMYSNSLLYLLKTNTVIKCKIEIYIFNKRGELMCVFHSVVCRGARRQLVVSSPHSATVNARLKADETELCSAWLHFALNMLAALGVVDDGLAVRTCSSGWTLSTTTLHHLHRTRGQLSQAFLQTAVQVTAVILICWRFPWS